MSINSESLKQNENTHAYISKGKEAAQGFYKMQLTVTLTKVIRRLKTATFYVITFRSQARLLR